MEPAEFDSYTERLRRSLASTTEVLGLVTLGTTAAPAFRDEWSDHDFWVITQAGAQDSLLQDLSWLPDADDILITVSHGNRRRTMLYRNRHKAEFAVFDIDEAKDGKAERYAILIDRGGISDLMASIHKETHDAARRMARDRDGLENLCVLLWSACERHCRGELLSARQYMDEFAVRQLLNLVRVVGTESRSDKQDELDPFRRVEQTAPVLAAELLRMRQDPIPRAALRVLDIAERELKQKAPDLAWEKLEMIRSWISGL